LFYLEELSYEEITVITNLSLANIKVKLHRSKKKLKRLLTPQEFAQRV
jgi:DNA-directed RNA polymerase specialized sigma24 family protein